MSLVLTLVAFVEVGGLALIAFFIINLGNLTTKIAENVYLLDFLNYFSISSDQALWLFCGLVFIYSLFSVVVSILSIRLISIFSEMVGSNIKTRLLSYYLNLDWGDFTKTQSSKTISRILVDADRVADIINFLMNLFNKIILTTLIILSLFVFNSFLTFWLSLILGSAYILIFQCFKYIVSRNSWEIVDLTERSISIVNNMFGSFKELLFYGNQKKVTSNFKEEVQKLANLKGVNTSYGQTPRYLIDAILLLLLAGFSVFVTYENIGTMAFYATLSVYGVAALKLLPAFQNIFYFSHEIYTRLPNLENVKALLIKPLRKENKSESSSLLSFEREISFNNVSFSFDGSSISALKDINLTIKKGEKIAIVGPTGSGKSTFIDILLGFLEPVSGAIYMDHQKITPENQVSFRTNFAFVPQKIFFLEDTLKENIIFGSKVKIEEDRLLRSIKDSNLELLVSKLKEGVDTPISDYNQMVSGGQKQSIGIARAFYRGGKILILDEATGAMDSDLEKKIHNSIFESKFENIVCITHKANLLSDFDKIIVFRDGEIEEMGTLPELKERNNFIKEMLNPSVRPD